MNEKYKCWRNYHLEEIKASREEKGIKHKTYMCSCTHTPTHNIVISLKNNPSNPPPL